MTDDIEHLPLAHGWINATLRECSENISYGVTASAASEPVGPRFLRITDIQENQVDWSTVPYCLCQDTGRSLLAPGDIVIARTGATTGKSYLIRDTPEPTVFASYLIRVRVNGGLLPSYLEQFMHSQDYWKQITDISQGTAQPGANATILGGLIVPIAPFLEQRRIVAKLEELFSELDAGVAALRRAQRRLARYRQALLQAAVTGELTREWRGQQTHDIKLGKLDIEPPAWLPLGWDWTTLGEASEVTGGLTKNQRRPALPRQVPYLRVANVYADELRLEEVEKIGILEGELRRALLQKEDLLIVEGNGSLDQIGRVAIWDGSIDPCVHQNHIIKARLSERVLPRFALLWLLSPLGRDAIVEQASSTSGLHTLSISKVSGLPLPIPPIQEQQAIVAEYDRRNSLADALRATTQASLRRAERLRQSILERAFRGELVPQDPNDEPAEALLARLRASGTEAPAPRRRGRLPKAEPAEPQPSRRRGRPRKDAEA